MSKLHGLADDDMIWDAVYGETEFVFYDRSECAPLLRVVAAELRRQADEIDRGCARYVQEGWSETERIKAADRIKTATRLRARAIDLDGSAA